MNPEKSSKNIKSQEKESENEKGREHAEKTTKTVYMIKGLGAVI